MSAIEPTPIQPESTPPPSAPAATPTPAPSTPAPVESRRETIARELKTPTPRGQHAQHQPRTEVGKFAGPPKFPTPPVAQIGDVPATVPQLPSRPAMPKSLKLELAPHWE